MGRFAGGGAALSWRIHPQLCRVSEGRKRHVPEAARQIVARTFERGVEDFTLACGTGAGSTAAAMRLRGELGNETLTLDFPGGELQVSLSVEDDTVCDIYLTGPAIVVAEGKYIGA